MEADVGEGEATKQKSVKKTPFTERGQAMQWLRSLVRNSAGTAFHLAKAPCRAKFWAKFPFWRGGSSGRSFWRSLPRSFSRSFRACFAGTFRAKKREIWGKNFMTRFCRGTLANLSFMWHVCRTKKLPPKIFNSIRKRAWKKIRKEIRKKIRSVSEECWAPLRPLKNTSPALFLASA